MGRVEDARQLLLRFCSLEELLELTEGPIATQGDDKPEDRMSKTLADAAHSLGLKWKDKSPPDHPYGAQLDGVLLRDEEEIAIVELEAEVPKQIRGALLDLLTYPKLKKVLVIGRASAPQTHKTILTKLEIVNRVLPALEKSLGVKLPKVGVFTEDGLIRNAKHLEEFLVSPVNCSQPNT